MAKKKNSTERSEATDKKKFNGWKRVITTVALASTLAACDKVPNNQIIINPDAGTEQFSFEYILGSGDPIIIDHNITVYKRGNIYVGLINKKDGWFSEKTTIESNSIDGLFQEISRTSDIQEITEDTRARRDAKIDFAKQAYKDNILNKTESSKKEIKIKYNPK